MLWVLILSFNPRSRVGSDSDGFNLHVVQTVSIHAPAWGATAARHKYFFVPIGFNPRSRVGSDCQRPAVRCASTRFNSRSRVGSDLPTKQIGMFRSVSIHAPAWGATVLTPTMPSATSEFQSTLPRGVRPNYLAVDMHHLSVSIHAPAWGATDCHKGRRRLDVSFNPRSRVGSDINCKMCIVVGEVSIHAPAWGAT